jgi:hypothetical protein
MMDKVDIVDIVKMQSEQGLQIIIETREDFQRLMKHYTNLNSEVQAGAGVIIQ